MSPLGVGGAAGLWWVEARMLLTTLQWVVGRHSQELLGCASNCVDRLDVAGEIGAKGSVLGLYVWCPEARSRQEVSFGES